MANITKVYLLNVPLENDYKNTLYFNSKADQQNYFAGLPRKSFEDFTYQRKDGIIRIPLDYDECVGYNYVMYQNPAQSNKWYYAFITDIKYVNDGKTDITIETDVMQTWLFDYTVLTSFVEREHVEDDTRGKHIIDEGLQIGEYVVNGHQKANYTSKTYGPNNDQMFIVVGVTETSDGTRFTGSLYNGIYSGLGYYAFPLSEYATTLQTFLSKYDSGKADAIVCMFLAPYQLLESYITANKVMPSSLPSTHYINSGDSANQSNSIISFSVNRIDDFTPDNNKLLTYPYRYLLVSNNNGTDVVYKYENWYLNNNGNKSYYTNPLFKIEGCLTPGCSIRMIPLDYRGSERSDIDGINMGKFPTLNWTSDYFTNWLTQNAVNIGIDTVKNIGAIGVGAVGVATGVGAGVGIGGIVSGLSGIAGTLAETYKADLVPNQSKGNINCGDIITSSKQNDFHFYDMCIKKEFARIIDNFFTMFGYKVNDVKIPNKNHRPRYWFTKTVDVNIDGGIPAGDMQKIKDCYNRGITFWKDHSGIGRYGNNKVS
jgi:hypothetical protein